MCVCVCTWRSNESRCGLAVLCAQRHRDNTSALGSSVYESLLSALEVLHRSCVCVCVFKCERVGVYICVPVHLTVCFSVGLCHCEYLQEENREARRKVTKGRIYFDQGWTDINKQKMKQPWTYISQTPPASLLRSRKIKKKSQEPTSEGSNDWLQLKLTTGDKSHASRTGGVSPFLATLRKVFCLQHREAKSSNSSSLTAPACLVLIKKNL